ncbi:unnamed protein product [Arabidopsis thaliana]|uniref:NAC domain-containing protein n=1 Tax=Arabidopsis thaliana TaxID=3702 RepID=A0A5S9Y9Z7_ARATH|nr:unnamed protein product [Arabidopsis thaliana]
MADLALSIFYKMKQVISMGGIMWEEEFEKGNDKEWFIITERNKVDQGLSQTKRVGNGAKRQKRVDTNGGYWHATVAAQKINAGDGVVGNKRPLAYYDRKPSEDVKTDWLMQEYSLDHNNDKVRLHFVQDLSYSTSNKEVGEEKKKQKKGEPVEASEGQQPCNAEYHQLRAPLDSCQPQPHDLAEQLDLHQPDQLQLQQPHDIVYQHSIVYFQNNISRSLFLITFLS